MGHYSKLWSGKKVFLERSRHDENNFVCRVKLYNCINLCDIVLFLCAVLGYAFWAVLGLVYAVMESADNILYTELYKCMVYT